METKFTIEDKDFYIIPVNTKIINEGQKVYNKAFRQAIEDGAFLRKKLDSYMRDQNLWDDKREQEYINLIKKIADHEYKLNKGSIKLDEARELALELRESREDLKNLIFERNYLDSLTAEGQADSQRFNYLVSACVYSELTRKPVFTLDEYLEKMGEDFANKITQKFASYLYGYDENYDSSVVENRFLKRFKFIDENGKLIDKDGKLVNREGDFVNEDGNRINKDGERVDINNNPILSTKVEDVEFLE